jgi:hypothetical protein
MNCFPDKMRGPRAACATAVLPLLFLVVALLYSASAAPWGRQVDPEAAYAMNGIAWAADGMMRKNDHPGTITTLLAGSVVKLGALMARTDVVEFGLSYFDPVIYVSRAIEALILSAALFFGGIIVGRVTGSVFAAMLFQVGPFVHPELLYWEMLLAPESLMISSGIAGMAFVLKAAIEERRPALWLGAVQGLTWALGVSAKYLSVPFAVFGVSLLRNPWASALACLAGGLSFFLLNYFLNPFVFTLGLTWLFNLATHKGAYGAGDAGLVDFGSFWSNMAEILAAAPIVSAVFAIGAFAAVMRMAKTRRFLDPIFIADQCRGCCGLCRDDRIFACPGRAERP